MHPAESGNDKRGSNVYNEGVTAAIMEKYQSALGVKSAQGLVKAHFIRGLSYVPFLLLSLVTFVSATRMCA